MLESTVVPDGHTVKQDEHVVKQEQPLSVSEQRITDISLIKDAQAGNPEAFGMLFERHALTVYRFLSAHLDDMLDVEDLTEDVFLKAWRALPRYRETGVPFAAFLLRIARNIVIDYYRNARRSEVNLEPESDREPGEAQVARVSGADSPDPGETVITNLEHRELRLQLDCLRKDYRTVLVARFLGELSPEETARLMGKTVGAVRVLQHRALAALRKLLAV
jgi:RNA polymerase sigma-70 factor, ECF subfamily